MQKMSSALSSLIKVHLAGGQVKCFCDRDSCDDNLLCQGDYCFIGLKREDSGELTSFSQSIVPLLNFFWDVDFGSEMSPLSGEE